MKMKFNIWVSFDADEELVTALSPPVDEDEQELLERAIAMSLEEWELDFSMFRWKNCWRGVDTIVIIVNQMI